jgi:hypothetical protein
MKMNGVANSHTTGKRKSHQSTLSSILPMNSAMKLILWRIPRESGPTTLK